MTKKKKALERRHVVRAEVIEGDPGRRELLERIEDLEARVSRLEGALAALGQAAAAELLHVDHQRGHHYAPDDSHPYRGDMPSKRDAGGGPFRR